MNSRPAAAGATSTLLLCLAATTLARGAAAPDPDTAVARLIGAALTSERAADRLALLCDRFGHRLSGSPALEAAIDWVAAEMAADGLTGVRREPVMVPVWVRGAERARLLWPVERELRLLGLGMSVGTPPGGVEAEVVVVGSFAELDALAADPVAAGRIVLYDVPFTGYGETVAYRSGGASHAARLGAVAALVRSVTPVSLDTPHTGALGYAADAPHIPAAALTVEDAALLRRLAGRGERPCVRLEMAARRLGDAPSANLVAEVEGRERPGEVVVLGAHVDSWDVGQGAADDGAGVVAVWEAARLIRATGLRPRRTVRVVLFTNEENGLRGARGYVERHRGELGRHVAAIEVDAGAGLALGFSFEVPPLAASVEPDPERARQRACDGDLARRVRARLEAAARRLDGVVGTRVECGGSGADVGQLVKQGVLGLGLDQDVSHYFDVHHSPADTVDKVDPAVLKRNVAALAVMAWELAEAEERPLPTEAPTLR